MLVGLCELRRDRRRLGRHGSGAGGARSHPHLVHEERDRVPHLGALDPPRRRAERLHQGSNASGQAAALRGSRKSVGGLVFLSSASGLPPFYVISTLAGALRVSFAAFILVGTAGRFLRFAAVGFGNLSAQHESDP